MAGHETVIRHSWEQRPQPLGGIVCRHCRLILAGYALVGNSKTPKCRRPASGRESATAGMMPESGTIEVRCPALVDGTTPLDEIVGRQVDIHLEQMSDRCWWMEICGKDKTVTVRLFTRRAPIMSNWDDDEPVCWGNDAPYYSP